MKKYDGVDALPLPPDQPGYGRWKRILVPEDGDKRAAKIINVAFKGVINRLDWLRHRMVDGLNGGSYPASVLQIAGFFSGSDYIFSPPKQVPLTVEGNPFTHVGSDWQITSTYPMWRSNNVGTTSYLYVPLHVPADSKLKRVEVIIKGGAGAMPAILANAALYCRDVTAGQDGYTSLQSVLDTSPDATAYHAVHSLIMNMDLAIDRSNKLYYAVVRGDSNGGVTFLGAKVVIEANSVGVE